MKSGMKESLEEAIIQAAFDLWWSQFTQGLKNPSGGMSLAKEAFFKGWKAANRRLKFNS